MTFRFTFLPSFLCRQQQQDSARNALTHPRSALDENSLVRPSVADVRTPHSGHLLTAKEERRGCHFDSSEGVREKQ